MAIKKRDVQEKSKLAQILTTEYRWENLLLGILAVASAALAIMIINKSLKIDENFPVLGSGKFGIIFAWILLVISIIGIFLVIYPYLSAAAPEMKRITWPTKKKFAENSAKTLIYLIVLTLILFLFDYLIIQIIQKIIG